jgi:hypothetical protein
LEDTADVFLANLDVSLLTPGRAPRVLDEEVVFTVLGTIANSKDTVIKTGSTCLGGDNTSGVTLECHLVSLDGNGDRLLHKGSLHSTDALLSDILEGSDSDNTTSGLGFVTLTGLSLSRGVRILSLSDQGVGLNIFESIVHKTTVAAIVLGGALDKLLFREGNELARLDEVSTLQRSGGGESPARSTVQLVLNRGDTALGNPVDGIRKVAEV